MITNKNAIFSGLALLTLLSPFPAVAEWPDKPITLVAPYTAGGNADILARLVARPLSDRLGTPIVVENRPGAGGMIGSQHVARAKPDGYTLLLGSVANILYKHFYKDVPVELESALQPVSQIASFPNFVVVPTDSELNSIQDVIDHAKSGSEKLSCGNPGIGTTPYLTCELLKTRLGIEITNVPYRGSVPAITDVMGGQITLAVASEALPYVKDNRLKAIAVSSQAPTPLAPDVPPLSRTAEGFDVVSWFGIFAPQGTPEEVIDRVSTELATLLQDQEIRASLANLGAAPAGTTSTEFSNYYQSEAARWQREIESMDIASSQP